MATERDSDIEASLGSASLSAEDLDSESAPGDGPVRGSRRRFLRNALGAAAAVPIGLFGYGLVEAMWLRVSRISIAVPRLPEPFRGLQIALLADIHHGPVTGLGYVRKAVDLTNELGCDLIALGGDYILSSEKYIRPCFEVLKDLSAPLGVVAVLGNHDHWHGPRETHAAIGECGFRDLTNSGFWIEKDGARLRLCGVGDLWEDDQDLEAALGETGADESAVVLSHNPDFAEIVEDPRVGLILSGHTHGGQVVFPILGAPFVPSAYGEKYRQGLVKTPVTQVFVSRGLATITPPVRFRCPPEIVVVELV